MNYSLALFTFCGITFGFTVSIWITYHGIDGFSST